jgi:mono/diheme cytochrome c family protein
MRSLSLISVLQAMIAMSLAGSAGAQVPVDIERGSEVAQRSCSGCHAVALEAASRAQDAPPFRVLSRLYSAQSLERKLTSIAADGHFEMPRVSLTEDQISDVSAYIASLQPLEDRAPSPTPKGRRPTASVARVFERTL